MKNKDFIDRAQRLDKRNALIKIIFEELTIHEGYSFGHAYIFLGNIFGINDRQIRKILLQKQKVALSADDVTKLAVILHRISRGTRMAKRVSSLSTGWRQP